MGLYMVEAYTKDIYITASGTSLAMQLAQYTCSFACSNTALKLLFSATTVLFSGFRKLNTAHES